MYSTVDVEGGKGGGAWGGGATSVATSNVNDIETKRREASIMGIFAKSKRNELVK